jgi:tetratricopeptide (TPR) repeat protein
MPAPHDPRYYINPANTAEARRLFAAAQDENDLPARAALYDQAAASFVSAGEPQNYVIALHNAAVTLKRADQPVEAQRRLDAALKKAERLDDAGLRSMVLNTLGGVQLGAGMEGAIQTYVNAATLARVAVDPHAEALASYNLAWAAFAAGDYEQCAQRLPQLPELTPDGGGPQFEGLASMTLARLHLRRGRFDVARPLLDWAHHAFDYAGFADFAALATFMMGTIACLEGDWAVGPATVLATLGGISQAGNRRATVPRLCALSALAARAGDAEEASRFAGRAAAWLADATPLVAALAGRLAAGGVNPEDPALVAALDELVARQPEVAPLPATLPWLHWRYGEAPAWAMPSAPEVAGRRLQVPPDQVVWSYYEDLSGGVDAGNYRFEARYQDLLRRRDPRLLSRLELDTEADGFNVVATSQADMALAMAWVNVLNPKPESNPAKFLD